MKQPTPAIVPQSAVRRLPRLALWLFCAAYVLPGLFGREPWKGNEVTAFGHMLTLAEGSSNWFNPAAWGQPPALDALLPYWLGAWAIELAPHWISASLAARLPFAALLGLTLAATWHGVYYLALSPQAQPVPFAFGGEAKPKDYARTIADGAVLGLIACLGLALLSHEASPILAQLTLVSLSFYGVAALPYHPRYSFSALFVGLVGLCLSGAPSFAVLMAIGSGLLCFLDQHDESSQSRTWHALGLSLFGLIVAVLAYVLDIWHWRLISPRVDWPMWREHLRLLAWFTWPAWPLVLWTLWRWRRQWASLNWSRHLVLPLWLIGLTISTAILTASPQQTLLLSLPAMAALAAFALPTMRRSVTSLIDWFALLFFSACAITIWVVWLAMQTGWPHVTASNVARLAPEFKAEFSGIPLIVAALATFTWGWLVFWRTRRQRHAMWKSLVLPAGGAALCWLLLMTLWLPLLDFMLGYKAWADRLSEEMKLQTGLSPAGLCVLSQDLDVGQMTAFKYHSKLNIQLLNVSNANTQCDWLIVGHDSRKELQHKVNTTEWTHIRIIRRPSDKREALVLYHRR